MSDYTLPGGNLPSGALPPTLLFEKWQAWDSLGGQETPKRKNKEAYLDRVAREVERLGKSDEYLRWHGRFVDAAQGVGARLLMRATTAWRLVADWAANPSLEVGMSLERFHGFPVLRGSAIKGLAHRVAEMELVEGGIPKSEAAQLPAEPPPGLGEAVRRARLVRVLFGSLNLRSGNDGEAVAPWELLQPWRHLLQEHRRRAGSVPEPWAELEDGLGEVCREEGTGGMVRFLDAIPRPDSFGGSDPILQVDVITPHGDGGTNPIAFLAVRPGVVFEFRVALAPLPPKAPTAQKRRDGDEAARRAAVEGWTVEQLLVEVGRWLKRGLAEEGFGAKTSSGYGFLWRDKRLEEEETRRKQLNADEGEDTTEDEGILAPDLDPDAVSNVLDKAIEEGDEDELAALTREFQRLYPDLLAAWRKKMKPAKQRRLRALEPYLEDGEGT